jgi:hypothetical protein
MKCLTPPRYTKIHKAKLQELACLSPSPRLGKEIRKSPPDWEAFAKALGMLPDDDEP